MIKKIHKSTGLFLLTGVLFLGLSYGVQAKIWQVGPDFAIKKPSTAIKRAKNGDIIRIAAGIYENDYSIINQDNLLLVGINGFAHMKSSGHIPGGKAIWVTNGNNITIHNIEFSGAKVPDNNGAGIRLQNGSLSLNNCYFHDNQMGIITAAGEITLNIINSEFSHNILIPPTTHNPAHNIYVGNIQKFTMKNSISRGAEYGHAVKSRAKNNILIHNRIFDETEISSSYLIDIPNGGNAYIENNYLYKNKGSQNNALISYGAEGMKYENNSLIIKSNRAINESGVAFLVRNHSNIETIITGNKTTNIMINELSGIEKSKFWDNMKNKISNYFKETDKTD